MTGTARTAMATMPYLLPLRALHPVGARLPEFDAGPTLPYPDTEFGASSQGERKMSDAISPPKDYAEAETPPKKMAWTKPTVRPLYQIEGVSTQPVFDPNKVGEFGDTYRGVS